MARCLNDGVDHYLDIASARAAAFELHPRPETRAQAQSAFDDAVAIFEFSRGVMCPDEIERFRQALMALSRRIHRP